MEFCLGRVDHWKDGSFSTWRRAPLLLEELRLSGGTKDQLGGGAAYWSRREPDPADDIGA